MFNLETIPGSLIYFSLMPENHLVSEISMNLDLLRLNLVQMVSRGLDYFEGRGTRQFLLVNMGFNYRTRDLLKLKKLFLYVLVSCLNRKYLNILGLIYMYSTYLVILE